MKKKLYQKPEMEVVELNHNQALLAGSTETPGCLCDGSDEAD